MTETAVVIDTGNRLPPFWDHGVVFFANLMALFFGNAQETASLEAEVGELDSYGGRLVPILNLLFRGDDTMLVLERDTDEALCDYFRADLGLKLPQTCILSHAQYASLSRAIEHAPSDACAEHLSVPAQHPAPWMDGFVTDDTLVRIAEALGKRTVTTLQGSRRGNNKLLLHQFLVETGLPHIDTLIAESDEEVRRCVRELAKCGFVTAIVKAQIGASGIGLLKLPEIQAADRLPPVPEHMFFEGPVMVQGWLQPGVQDVVRLRSPSVQLFLSESSVYEYDLTEQILNGESVHQGNESPPSYVDNHVGLKDELLRQAGAAGQWLHVQGYRGTASVDFLVADRRSPSATEVYVCEINARVTGATYPSMLARHMTRRGAWVHRNLRLSQPMLGNDLLDMLRHSGYLFVPQRGEGVLPVNFNFGADNLVHKGQFLSLGPTTGRCHEYFKRAEIELPVHWTFDRD